MGAVSPKIQEFATRIVSYEAGDDHSFTAKLRATFLVCEKLRLELIPLIGTSGFCALLLRALALSSEDADWLPSVKVTEEGILKGFEELNAKQIEEAFSAEVIALPAQFLGLLITLIGDRLTVQLLNGVWPKLELRNLEDSREYENKAHTHINP